MKEMIKNTFILLAITLVAGAALGFVYENTKDIIAASELEAKENAYREVFKDADSFEEMNEFMNDSIRSELDVNGFSAERIDEINIAKSSAGDVMGYVLTVTTSEGYGGDIQFTMGIRNDGTLNGMSILSISETAGLGMEAEKVLKPQFVNRTAESFVYSKTGATMDNEIDAISGATITTNAVTNGINTGLYYFYNYLGGASNE